MPLFFGLFGRRVSVFVVCVGHIPYIVVYKIIGRFEPFIFIARFSGLIAPQREKSGALFRTFYRIAITFIIVLRGFVAFKRGVGIL